jgi:hypothetical protein
MTKERRKHRRVEASLSCRLVNAAGKEEGFDLLDLSESGARLQCASALAPMTRIRVVMVLPGERLKRQENVPLETEGVVVWSHRVEGGSYDTGVFFPVLDDDQRALLRAYVFSAVV